MANDPNSEMLAASEVAVGAAKKELRKALDYSTDSFKNLEALIQHVKSHFSNLKKEGRLTDQTVQRATVSIGAYLGETIRRHHGGNWIAKNAVMKTLVIDGQEFSPILYIFQRLRRDSDLSLENYWTDIHQTLHPSRNIQERTLDSEPLGKPLSTSSEHRKLILGGLVGIVILCFVGMLSVTVYSNIKRTNEFHTKIDNFLLHADKLDLMTEQGVSYQEFRTQLVDVKSAYSSIDYWPTRYRDEKLAFDNAIEGWDLTLDVWRFGIEDPNIEFDWAVGNYYDDALINYWSIYAGVELAAGKKLTTDEWIGGLMGKASTYFHAGKEGIR